MLRTLRSLLVGNILCHRLRYETSSEPQTDKLLIVNIRHWDSSVTKALSVASVRFILALATPGPPSGAMVRGSGGELKFSITCLCVI